MCTEGSLEHMYIGRGEGKVVLEDEAIGRGLDREVVEEDVGLEEKGIG